MPRHPLTLLAITGLKLGLAPLLVLLGIAGAWGEAVRSDPTVPPESPGMRMILIGPARQFAIIDGNVVKPGDLHDGSKVLAIKAGELVMQDGSKSRRLTPGVVKKVITTAPSQKAGAAARKIKAPNMEPVSDSGGTQ